MKKMMMTAWILIPVAASAVHWGCSTGTPAPPEPAVRVEPPGDPNLFKVDRPEEFPLVETAMQRIHEGIDSNGVVAPDISRTVPVASLSGGRVVEILARLGDEVKKGQVLLRIDSADLAGAYADYHKAVADEILTRKALARTKALLEHGAAAQKDLEAAEDAQQKSLVDLRNTAERIRILGGSVDRPTTVLEVAAPVSGTIVEQNIQAAGGVKSLDNAPNLFTIADLSQVWILCDVYENNLSRVRLGDLAEVRLAAYPDEVLRGRITNISRLLDPATRTAKVRLETGNASGKLRPGMFAAVRFVSQSARERLVVPATAVLRLHDRDWVFKPEGANQFRRTAIEAGGMSPDGGQFVLAGLQPGDRVVKNALQLSATVEK